MAWGDFQEQVSLGKTEAGRGKKKGLPCINVYVMAWGRITAKSKVPRWDFMTQSSDQKVPEKSNKNLMRVNSLGAD